MGLAEATTALPRQAVWWQEAQEAVGVPLHHHSAGEAHGPCPQCGGRDRYVVFASGGSWCRQCGYQRRWSDNGTGWDGGRAELRLDAQQAMLTCNDWAFYHQDCLHREDAMEAWFQHDILEDAIRAWGLGFADACPLYLSSPSLTIPVWYQGRLLDIRHRLLQPATNDGKYRSHMSGIGSHLFNGDVLSTRWWSLVVEGEKKAILLSSLGWPVCSIPGIMNSGPLLKLVETSPGTKLVLAMDPGVEQQTARLAAKLVRAGAAVRIASFLIKPDDFLLDYGESLCHDVVLQARGY